MITYGRFTAQYSQEVMAESHMGDVAVIYMYM